MLKFFTSYGHESYYITQYIIDSVFEVQNLSCLGQEILKDCSGVSLKTSYDPSN